MDFSTLLNNTPFDQNKLILLQNLISILYKTHNNNDRTNANHLLNEFKSLENSWQACDSILTNSNCFLTKIYALGIMEDLVNSKFNLLQNEQKEIIRNFLIEILIKSISAGISNDQINSFVSKLNIVIVAIAKNEWPSTWPSFLQEICSSAKTSQELCENNVKLLIILSEEINEFWKNTLTKHKANVLQELMNKESYLIYDLFMFVLNNSLSVKKSLIKQAFKLFAATVKYYPLDKVFEQNLLSRFLDDLSKIPASRIDLMKCFGEIFSIKIEINQGEEYYKYKNLMLQLFKSYINQMQAITNNLDFYQEYNRIKEESKLNFEEFSLQFANSITLFFKNNFGFIQDFDTIHGESFQENDFTKFYMNEIYQGLLYLTQIHKISNNEEIFKLMNEFFLWLSFKICYLVCKEADPELLTAPVPYSIQNSIITTYQSHFYNKYYSLIIDIIRTTLIEKMLRPVEVKIDADEYGEIVVEQLEGTIFATLHETMRDCLIYVTHLDPVNTQTKMIDFLKYQMDDSNWNVNLLNSTSWAIGCISGTLDENEEKKFIIVVIKYLLTLCESKKGKHNKAFVASNIMYIVGQYYRFLNTNWRFLKTVVKKLFEFMHEEHPGVQDFACETFLKISIKCGYQFVIVNEDESEPYINILTKMISEDTKDLHPHQKLMFYEAIGTMISCENDIRKQTILINNMMSTLYRDWKDLFNNAQQNTNILLENLVIKGIDITLKLNEKVAISVHNAYYSFATFLLDNIINSYIFYSNIGNQIINNQVKLNINSNTLKNIRRSLLRYLSTLVSSTDDTNILLTQLLPKLAPLIEQYRVSHIDNRDPDVLIVFTEFLNKLKNVQYDYINSIWNYLCLITLSMIQKDYNSYPEHRLNFFTLVKSMITNAFDALFQIQEVTFNKDVLNAIIWAFRHDQPKISEIGLETLLILLNVSSIIYFI